MNKENAEHKELARTELASDDSPASCASSARRRSGLVFKDRSSRRGWASSRKETHDARGQVSNSSTAARIRRTSFEASTVDTMDFWRSENGVYGLAVDQEEA